MYSKDMNKAMPAMGVPLLSSDFRPGVRIIRRATPADGVWTVMGEYASTLWEVRHEDGRTLRVFESDASGWNLIHEPSCSTCGVPVAEHEPA